MKTFLYVMAFFVTALGIAFSVLWGMGRLPPVIMENLRIVLGASISVVAGILLLGLAAANGGGRTGSALERQGGRDRPAARARPGGKTEPIQESPASEQPSEGGQSDDEDIFLVNPLDE